MSVTSPAEDWSVLREQNDVALQQASEAQRRVEPVDVEDDSRQVFVRISPDGLVESVRIGFAWDSALRADQLAPTVMNTISKAQLQRIEQLGRAMEEVDAEPAPRARPSFAPDFDAVSAEIALRTGPSGDEFIAARSLITELLNDALDGIAEADAVLETHTHRSFVGRSQAGHVHATLSSAGDLTALDIDPRWAEKAHPTNIGREVIQAITHGVEQVRTGGLKAALEATRLAKLALLATDPNSYFQR